MRSPLLSERAIVFPVSNPKVRSPLFSERSIALLSESAIALQYILLRPAVSRSNNHRPNTRIAEDFLQQSVFQATINNMSSLNTLS